jgi:hypothetical protein
MKVEVREWMAGVWHCSLFCPPMVGREVGSRSGFRESKCCRQMRSRVMLRRGTATEPKAVVNNKKGGRRKKI